MTREAVSFASTEPRRPSLPTLSIFASALVILLLGCSQNEYSVKGKVPPAPSHPRDAHVVKKSDAGMNSVGGPEEEMPAQQAQEASAAGPGNVLRGEVTLPPALGSKFKAGETLYVIVRDTQGDPTPLAAQKLVVKDFPVPFEIAEKDAMMGGAIPAKAQIILRLDEDGDLSTQGPNDLVGGPVTASAGQPVTIPLEAPPK